METCEYPMQAVADVEVSWVLEIVMDIIAGVPVVEGVVPSGVSP